MTSSGRTTGDNSGLGGQSNQDATTLLRQLLTTVVTSSGQIPQDKIGTIEGGIRQVHTRITAAAGMSPEDLRSRGTHKVLMDSGSSGNLPSGVRHMVSDILTVLDGRKADSQDVRTTADEAVGTLTPLMDEIGLETAGASGTQSGSGGGTRLGSAGQPSTLATGGGSETRRPRGPRGS